MPQVVRYDGAIFVRFLRIREVIPHRLPDRSGFFLPNEQSAAAQARRGITRQPEGKVLLHSDQGCQFTSHDWQDFLEANNFTASMSRRGNCYDNAVVESFFQLLKRERIKRRVYATREDARADIFDYIEMFYNPIRRHGHNNGLSPVQFEKQFSVR